MASAAKTEPAHKAMHMESAVVVNTCFMMVLSWLRWNRRHTPRWRSKRETSSAAAEPVVALVFPIASVEGVAHEDGLYVFRILVAKLGGHAQLHWEAVLGR